MKFTEEVSEIGDMISRRRSLVHPRSMEVWCSFSNQATGTEIIVKDVIADAMLQQF